MSGARRNDPRKRPVSKPFDRPVPQPGQRHGRNQHHDKHDRQRAQVQNLGQNHEYDQSDEGRQHEQVAVSEIDHADDAENHRVADGDESVDRPQREPVNQLLQEIIHAPSYPLVSPRLAGSVPLTCGRPVLCARSIRRR